MFDRIEHARLDELHLRHDRPSGLRAIIAIHNTRLGPALGGCRCIEYANDEAAIDDAIRLARGMSYKNALADIPQGGGKAVIIKPAQVADRTALYRAFGQFINELGGRYITAVDSGTALTDMDEVAAVTPYASGTSRDGFDPSPMTALGVHAGIKAAVTHRTGQPSLRNLRVAIQGVGNVGYPLARLLHEDGARLLVSDSDQARVQRCVSELGAETVSPDAIYDAECDVFAPCGLGGVINEQTADRLRCAIVAGAANNQLADEAQGARLHERGILYAPDYVINAGGVIRASLGYLGEPSSEIRRRTLALETTLRELFERARAQDLRPEQVADRTAEDILYG